jgi:hypothetical protein
VAGIWMAEAAAGQGLGIPGISSFPAKAMELAM